MRAVATLSVALILLGFMGYVWGELPRRLRLPTDTMSCELIGVRITATPNGKRPAGAPDDERRTIRAALDFAGRQLSSLASAAGGEGGQILEFQVALLEDEDFLDPIFVAIEAGTPADGRPRGGGGRGGRGARGGGGGRGAA